MDQMDFIAGVHGLAAHVLEFIDHIDTEEDAKNVSVLPFIEALGYNVRNPLEVKAEYTADFGTKKGEKVDYVIMDGQGQPAILIEAKRSSVELGAEHSAQLFRYFSVTPATIAILTNGLVYEFYNDSDSQNLMDLIPFERIDLRELDDVALGKLARLGKGTFERDAFRRVAEELRYMRGLKANLAQLWEDPSEDFVKLVVSDLHDGRWVQSAMDRYKPWVKKAFHQFVTDRMNARLASAIEPEETEEPTVEAPPEAPVIELPEGVVAIDGEVVTTEEELAAFRLVQTLVGEVIDPDRVFMRDSKSYCAVLVDNNNRRPICRLKLDGRKKQVILLDADKQEERHDIESLKDLYRYAVSFREAALRYL